MALVHAADEASAARAVAAYQAACTMGEAYVPTPIVMATVG